jgi:ubiquinone biosynthesis protein UbiJ
MEDVSGLKSALEKNKERVRIQRDEIAALQEEVARLKEAFDKLTQAIALRNPVPPCSN